MEPWFMRIVLCVVGGALGATPAFACDLPLGETATVASGFDGETLTLTDGRTVRRLGIKAPSAPLGWKRDDPWPFVAETKPVLTESAVWCYG
jgi:endonuclease YncB( thermonuclease family)